MPNILTPQPRPEDLQATINACLTNASRLIDDALMLEFQEQGGGRLALCVLAQEEYAKAFLLYMVREEFLPWDNDLQRIVRNHACKHLLAIVMEYIRPDWDTLEDLRSILDAEHSMGDRLPAKVSTALNILYWEMIRRDRFDDDDADPSVRAVANGARDRFKQDAIYIDVDGSGRAKNLPERVTREDAATEYKRASQLGSIVGELLDAGDFESVQLQKLKDAMKIVFWQKYKPIAASDYS